jgi:predicted amidophosphoribosyltransferase
MSESTDRNTNSSPAASRRLVALERNYHCGSCGKDHRSWSRMRSCSACGETLTHAVIRRAALA